MLDPCSVLYNRLPSPIERIALIMVQVHDHTIVRILRRWRGASRLSKVRVAAVLLVAFAVACVALQPVGDTHFCHTNDWSNSKGVQFNPDLMHAKPISQRTIHFPFRTGCPHDCEPYRQRMCLDETATNFSRLTVQWYFGQTAKFDPKKAWAEQNGATNYPKGINFEAPEAFVRTFHAAARDLKDQGEQLLKVLPMKEFKVHKQKNMHASLSYLCCLTPREAKKGMEVIDKWIDKTEFNFTVRFTEIQSWHESPNSVTNIVLVDESSQIQMMRMNHDLNQHLESAGVPVIVPREDQMPFHATVAGFRFSKKGETFNPVFDITPQLPEIYSLVHDISEKYRHQWNLNEFAFRIQHKPWRSAAPSNHTHPLVEVRMNRT